MRTLYVVTHRPGPGGDARRHETAGITVSPSSGTKARVTASLSKAFARWCAAARPGFVGQAVVDADDMGGLDDTHVADEVRRPKPGSIDRRHQRRHSTGRQGVFVSGDEDRSIDQIEWSWALPFIGVMAAAVAAMAAVNNYALDGTALWQLLTTPKAVRSDVAGRQLAWMLIFGIPILIGTTLLCLVSQSPLWVIALGMTFAATGAACGAAPLFSLLMPAIGADARDRVSTSHSPRQRRKWTVDGVYCGRRRRSHPRHPHPAHRHRLDLARTAGHRHRHRHVGAPGADAPDTRPSPTLRTGPVVGHDITRPHPPPNRTGGTEQETGRCPDS